MTQVTFTGQPVNLSGDLPKVGQPAPDFVLCANDLSDYKLKDHLDNVLVLSIVPSLNTPVCAASARMFNKRAGEVPGVKVLNVSMDLPFAAGNFCSVEGLNNVISLSDFRDKAFGKAYGLIIEEGALRGLLARAVLVIGKDGKIKYKELVPEIAQEPNYDLALAAAKAATAE